MDFAWHKIEAGFGGGQDGFGRTLTDIPLVLSVWDGNLPLHEWTEPATTPPPPSLVENEVGMQVPTPPRTSVAGGLTTYVFEPGSFAPLAKFTPEDQFSIITDHLGTPLLMYDGAGQQRWSLELDIYGGVHRLESDGADLHLRYPGQYADGEIGLSYNRFRYYDAGEGVYISADPIGIAGGNPTLYGYVGDVTIEVDVLGLSCEKGTATIRQFENGHPEGHFSVEINFDGKSLHTHQVITGSKSTKIITDRVMSPGEKLVHEVSVDLSSGKAAMEAHRKLLNTKDLGEYDAIHNSCLTHVTDVLEAGGQNAVPKTKRGLFIFAKKTGFGRI